MIANKGVSKISLSREDLKSAIKYFLEMDDRSSTGYRINKLLVHRTGSKYAVSVEVSKLSER